MEQLKETNKFLTEKINSQNRNAYIKVNEIGSINEMKREVFKTNEDGTIKTTVVTQQFLDVTTRKRKSTDGNSDQKKSTNQQNKVFLGSNLKLKSAHLFLQREVL